MPKERGLHIDWNRKNIPDEMMNNFTEQEKAEAAASFLRVAFRFEPPKHKKKESEK